MNASSDQSRIVGFGSFRGSRCAMAVPANDNVKGGRHEVDQLAQFHSQQRQWPQNTTAAFFDVLVSIALLVLTWALFAFAFAMEG